MQNSLVSVILATYNGSLFLTEAIESVLWQDYKNLELIIIDDASTNPEVWEIIHHYKERDTRISSYRNDRNMERSYSKNLGASKAQWEYIAFIDDDDIWKSDKLSKQVEILLHEKNIWIVGTYARFIDESRTLLGETNHLEQEDSDIRRNILTTNQFIHSSVLIRKSVFLEAWGFPLDMDLCEDYDLWLRVLRITEWANIPEYLVDYRVRVSSTTAKNIYRMKWITLKLIWKYRLSYPWCLRALIIKIITFPLHTVFLMKAWKWFKQ